MNNINNNSILENQSLQELKKIKDQRLAKSSASSFNIENAAKGFAVNALEDISNKLGVDLKNPQEVNNALDKIKNAVTNPESIKKTVEILKGITNNASVYYKAVEPLVDPMVDKMLEVGSKAATKAGETLTVIASNTVKEIPGVGLAYALAQDASKIGEAFSAATNAAAEITTSASDSAIVFKKNLDKLKSEKAAIENRTMKSLNQFNNPLNNMSNKINSNINNSVNNLSNNLSNNINNINNKINDNINNNINNKINNAFVGGRYKSRIRNRLRSKSKTKTKKSRKY